MTEPNKRTRPLSREEQLAQRRYRLLIRKLAEMVEGIVNWCDANQWKELNTMKVTFGNRNGVDLTFTENDVVVDELRRWIEEVNAEDEQSPA